MALNAAALLSAASRQLDLRSTITIYIFITQKLPLPQHNTLRQPFEHLINAWPAVKSPYSSHYSHDTLLFIPAINSLRCLST